MKENHKSLVKAKAEKNDEFYTRLEDINNELQKYRKQLKDKVIVMPADDTDLLKGLETKNVFERSSQFWNFFHQNLKFLGIKKIIATHYSPEGNAYKAEYDGSGNDADLADFTKTKLKGDGDFRSDEVKEIIASGDIVITNPPFSLFREFVKQIVEEQGKDVLIIGNKNAYGYKEIFKLIKENKLRSGYTNPKKFLIVDENGVVKESAKVQGLTRWFTTLKVKKADEEILLYKRLSEGDYQKYDNYDAINVDKVKDIPEDYFGEIGVPITFLDRYNPKQFEITRFRKGNDNKDLKINGKDKYSRIIIKRRINENN